MQQMPELTVLMPCLNEAKTLPFCIAEAKACIEKNGYSAEVLIADNGSTDGSAQVAEACGARVVQVEEKGYGSTLRFGIAAARGKYIIMGDSDGSYDFGHLEDFVEKLRQGDTLVMGNRFRGGIQKGAMPFLHRYFGVPLLSLIGRLRYRVKIGDFHCGLRGFDRETALRLQLKSTGMEFATEIIGKFARAGEKIAEIPTVLRPDLRQGKPHLRSIPDGFRHLRLMLLEK